MLLQEYSPPSSWLMEGMVWKRGQEPVLTENWLWNSSTVVKFVDLQRKEGGREGGRKSEREGRRKRYRREGVREGGRKEEME